MEVLTRYLKETGIKDYCKKANFNQNTYLYESDFGLIYFSEIDTKSEELFNICNNIWCENKSEISLMILGNNIYLCDSKTKPSKEYLLDKIKIMSFSYGDNSNESKEIVELFKKNNIDSGVLWNEVYSFIQKRIKDGKRLTIDEDLLENLISRKNNIIKIINTADADIIAQKLIDRCLFIRYLEDKINSNKLKDILEKNDSTELLKLFKSYNDSLNGDLFKEDYESLRLNNKVLSELKKIFGNVYSYPGGQQTIFPYEFSRIPVSLISQMYEKFLRPGDRNKRGAVYTPSNLVDYILEKVLARPDIRKKIINNNIKILDPACGSGIFLVKFLEKSVNLIETDKNKKLTVDEVSEFIRKSIYGIDINDNALRVAAFSMYLKIFDTLSPSKIQDILNRKDFMFPGLKNNNLINKNTLFDEINFDNSFDLIVGNPPWGFKFSRNERTEIIPKLFPQVSDSQSSQCFIFRVMKFIKKDGISALIVNSSNFLNEKSSKFRLNLVNSFSILELVNLNKIKKITFGESSEPATLVIYQQKNEKQNSVVFNSIELCTFSEFTKIIIENQNNRLLIDEAYLINDLNWTPTLNNYHKHLETISKISEDHPPLSNFMERCDSGVRIYLKQKHGDRDLFYKNNFSSESKKGWYPIVDSINNISNFNAPSIKKYANYDNFFQPRDLEIFKGDKLIITRSWPIKCFVDTRLTIYDDNFFIFKPKENHLNLINYFNYLLNSNVATFFYIILYLQRGDGDRSKVNKNNILKLPIPNISNAQINQLTRCKSSEERNKLIYELYDLDYKNIQEIEDFIKEYGKLILVTEEIIRGYVEEFKKGYKSFIEENKYINSEFEYNELIGAILKISIANERQPFIFRKTKFSTLLNLILKNRLKNNLFLLETKLKIYDKSNFYIYKSNKSKDWTRTEAIKDLNEELNIIFSELDAT